MIRFQTALEIVLQHASRLPITRIALEEALGLVLAQDVTADVNMPPFHRSSMDGYAVRAEDLTPLPATLEVVGTVPAGSYPDFTLRRGQAARIMTGAPLPEGADSVQIVEKTRILEDGKVEISEDVKPGANVTPQGSEARLGEVVARSGSFISPALIGLLAAVGQKYVAVYLRPSVAVVATGNELVDIEEEPVAGQIRNSNSYGLSTQIRLAGGEPVALGVARDKKDELRSLIEQGLDYDLLLLSGGVSMGDLDLVKEVFHAAGIEILFDKVAVKPGKPVVFGKQDRRLVFGLPGNPVSAATMFELLVRPAMRKMMGFPVHQNQIIAARLVESFINRSNREYYAPAWTWYENAEFHVQPLKSKGSGDVVTYAQSNSYLICPIERMEFFGGEMMQTMLRTEFFYQ